jgi:hypothetical protein
MTSTHPDAELIKDLGGPAQVAVLLSLDKRKGGVQRVQNWITRGIPAAVKLNRPDLFLPEFSKREASKNHADTGLGKPELNVQERTHA